MGPNFPGGPSGQTSPTSSQMPHGSKASGPSVVSIHNILNDTGSSGPPAGSSSANSSQQPVINEASVNQFLDTIAERTSGCTIEQLEQINRELMDEIWRLRHEWNRMRVLSELHKVFNDTIADIETLQGLMASSQERQPGDERHDATCVFLN
jgi:hypothetical protein